MNPLLRSPYSFQQSLPIRPMIFLGLCVADAETVLQVLEEDRGRDDGDAFELAELRERRDYVISLLHRKLNGTPEPRT